MKESYTSALRAVLMGLAALLLIVSVERAIATIFPRHPHFLGADLTGYIFLAVLIALPIMVAKFTNGRAWWHGLLAGIAMGIPLCIYALHSYSPDPRQWVWYMGRPMLWIWVALASLLLITSLGTESAALWFARRRLFAALVAVGSVGLVVAVFAAGFALMRFSDARTQAMQDNAALRQVDLPLPALALTAMDGTPISASELQGHITVIDFWGTWCGACLAEFPTLEAVHKEYSGNSVVRFLLVNPGIEGDSPEKVQHFLARRPVSIPVALDQETSYLGLSHKLNNNGLPLLLVIDQRGRIRFREYGFDDKIGGELRGKINALLAAQ